VFVELTDGIPAKLVFVRDNRKTDLLALLSTDISLDDEQVVQIYGANAGIYSCSLKWLSST